MGTEILNLKSFGTLQSELEQAKSSLKGVDENIKRLIGRDPSELPPRPSVVKRGFQGEERGRQRIVRGRNFSHENDEPPPKRRNNVSVFKRLSERPSHYEDDQHQQPQKQMISKVIVTPKELPSRQEALAAQSKDEKSKARNRRMFGALLGTLQKFQQEETKLKQKEEKRAQLEKKIEEHEIKEKEEIKKERQELFFNRKKKQAEIKMIELKMMRMKEYALWEERQKPRMNFILTKAKPHIHFMPRKMNEATKTLLESSRSDIEKMIDKKRQEVFDELQHIEERMKKNFELRKSNKDQTEEQQGEVVDASFKEDEDVEMMDLQSLGFVKDEEKSDNVIEANPVDDTPDEKDNVVTEKDEVSASSVQDVLSDLDTKKDESSVVSKPSDEVSKVEVDEEV